MNITREEILKNYSTGVIQECPLELEKNLQILLLKLNAFRKIYGKPMVVSSGYRDIARNKNVGGAKKSNHMLCLACDFIDIDGSLDRFCVDNIHLLKKCGLYLEHPKWTKGWCHLQVIPPSSNNVIFIPSNSAPPKNKHDSEFDLLKI
jgi:hypothetical protein